MQYNITDTYCIEQKTISYLHQYLRDWDENWRMKWMRGRPGWGMCRQSTQSWCADHWVWPLFDLGTLGGRRYQAICLHLYVQMTFMHCVHVLFCHTILFFTLTWNDNDFISSTPLCQHSLINDIPTNFTPTIKCY